MCPVLPCQHPNPCPRADAAGNTTAAIGKGFAIGSAALVSLALFGAYITRVKIDLQQSSILDPKARGPALAQHGLPAWLLRVPHACALMWPTPQLGTPPAAQVFAGLLFGAMLPYWFSAMTMKSVGKAALSMVEEVRACMWGRAWHGGCSTGAAQASSPRSLAPCTRACPAALLCHPGAPSFPLPRCAASSTRSPA